MPAFAHILLQAFPDDGWLSEETADRPDRLGKSRTWIIDPLDGTWEFTTGVPEFVVSIASLLTASQSLVCSCNLTTEETFSGIRPGRLAERCSDPCLIHTAHRR